MTHKRVLQRFISSMHRHDPCVTRRQCCTKWTADFCFGESRSRGAKKSSSWDLSAKSCSQASRKGHSSVVQIKEPMGKEGRSYELSERARSPCLYQTWQILSLPQWHTGQKYNQCVWVGSEDAGRSGTCRPDAWCKLSTREGGNNMQR